MLLSDSWMVDGECRRRGMSPNEFFLLQSGHYSKAALDACANCVVQLACMEYAVANEEYGLWGGTSERQRRRIRMGLKRQP